MNENVEMEIAVSVVSERLKRQEELLLLDCREQNEYEQAKIEGSVLIPMNEIPSRISEIESFREKPVIVYCHGGVRSLKVTQWLRQQGFANSQSMAGGIDAWSREIDPQVPIY